MTTELSALRRIAVYTEPNGSFAVDNTASPSAFLDVPFQEGSEQFTLDKAALEPNLAVQFRTDAAKTVVGPLSATLQFTIPLFSTGISANASTASGDQDSNALLRILKAVMGGLRGGTGIQGSAVVASPSPTSTGFSVTAGQGSRFTAGSAVGLIISSTLHVRELKTVTTDALALKIALPSAPSTSDVVYNSTTCYMAEDPDTSLQFIVEGSEQDDRWVLKGGQCTAWSINTPINELPTMQFSFSFASWAQLSGAAITNATYNNFEPNYVSGQFLAQATGTSTLNAPDIQVISFEPSVQFAPVQSVAGTQGVLRYKATRQLPACRVKFTTLYEDNTWMAIRDARTDYHLGLQIGTTTGKTVYLVCPAAQIETVQRVDNGGLVSQEVVARARLDSDATSTTTEIRRSGMRIHFL